VPFLHEGADAVFGSRFRSADYRRVPHFFVTRWGNKLPLASPTSTHVMSRSLLAKPAQACPPRGAERHEPPKGRMNVLFTTALIASMLILGST
jgi:hypothetical protein